MMTDVWTKREAGPLTVYCHEGSYACDNCDAVLERYQKALEDVCLFLDVQREALPAISVYLCEVLPPESEAATGPTAAPSSISRRPRSGLSSPLSRPAPIPSSS